MEAVKLFAVRFSEHADARTATTAAPKTHPAVEPGDADRAGLATATS